MPHSFSKLITLKDNLRTLLLKGGINKRREWIKERKKGTKDKGQVTKEILNDK